MVKVLKRNRKAKIIATLGPASSAEETIESLVFAGADVFRLNFSHGSHDDHRSRAEIIRGIEKKTGRPICILADMQGPKLRVGNFAAGKINLKIGDTFRFDLDPKPGDQNRAPLLHPEVFAVLKPGVDLLLDDGKLKLTITSHGSDWASARVVAGGELSNHKGVNLPNVVLPISPLTDKDLADLEFALQMGVDWVAMSFVQRPEDVELGQKLIAGRARLMSKLEKPSAIEHLDRIIELSDGIMVARGDLGVECPPETVPMLQKRIIRGCRVTGTPVVVATQMLDSMVHAPVPTRAEASDVATAIFDSADAVMLSSETAAGDFPVEAVTFMDHIIEQVEADEQYRAIHDLTRPPPTRTAQDAISAAAQQVAQTISAAAIVTFTSSGSTTLRTARERPNVPLLCLTPDVRVARQMALVWGAQGVVAPVVRSFGEMVVVAQTLAQEQGFATWNDSIVITAGVPFGTSGTTNILRVAVIEER